MKCIKCGYEFEEGLFCPECGTKYDEAEAKRIEIEEQEAEKKRNEEEKLRQEVLKQEAEERRIQEELRRKEEKEKRDLEIQKAKVEQERLAAERAAHEAELVRQQNEKARIEQVNKTRMEEQEKLRRKEEKEKRDLEIEKAKVEQERLAAQRVAHEVELVRQQNEKARIEQANKARMEEQEKKRQEKLKRTFNGVLYDSIDEMNIAKAKYGVQVEFDKKMKKANIMSILSFVLSIATYPLLMTYVLWLPALIVSIVFGVMALKAKTNKKGFTIASFVINGIFILICVLFLVFMFTME